MYTAYGSCNGGQANVGEDRRVHELEIEAGASSAGSSVPTSTTRDSVKVELPVDLFTKQGKVCDDDTAIKKFAYIVHQDSPEEAINDFNTRKGLEKIRQSLIAQAQATFNAVLVERGRNEGELLSTKPLRTMDDLNQAILDLAETVKVEISGDVDLEDAANTLSGEVLDIAEMIYRIFFAFHQKNAMEFVNRVIKDWEQNSKYTIKRGEGKKQGCLGGFARIILDKKKKNEGPSSVLVCLMDRFNLQ